MIVFVVPGKAIGKERPRFSRARKKKRAYPGAMTKTRKVLVYTPAKTANYEMVVGLHAKAAMAGKTILNEAVEVILSICISTPKSWPKKQREDALSGRLKPYLTKTDVDNIAKCILDACNKIVYNDDRQICRLIVEKYYGTDEHVKVVMGPMCSPFNYP